MIEVSERCLMKEIKTKTYVLDQGFFLDVQTTCKHYNAWLWHRDYGVKMHMFGMFKTDISYNDFVDLCQYELEEDILMYAEEYMDYEG